MGAHSIPAGRISSFGLCALAQISIRMVQWLRDHRMIRYQKHGNAAHYGPQDALRTMILHRLRQLPSPRGFTDFRVALRNLIPLVNRIEGQIHRFPKAPFVVILAGATYSFRLAQSEATALKVAKEHQGGVIIIDLDEMRERIAREAKVTQHETWLRANPGRRVAL